MVDLAGPTAEKQVRRTDEFYMQNPYQPSSSPKAAWKGTAVFRDGTVFCVGGIVGVTAIHMASGSVGDAINRTLSHSGNLLFSIVLTFCLYLSTFLWRLPRRLFFQPYQPTMIASFVSGAFLNCLFAVGIRSTSEQQIDAFINQYSASGFLLMMAAVAMVTVTVTVEFERVLTRLTHKAQCDGEPDDARESPS